MQYSKHKCSKYKYIKCKYSKYKYKSKLMTKRILVLVLILSYFMDAKVLALATPIPKNQQDDQVEYNKTDSLENQGLVFENAWVEAGVPLVVQNVPKGDTLQWVITSANGTQQSFTSIENYYIPKAVDEEKLITVSLEQDESITTSIYFSALPVVYINNSGGYNAINRQYTNADLSMQASKLFNKQKLLYNGNISIKLEGDTKKTPVKRSFEIELDENMDLLGLGDNKHWVLEANELDHTLMRNKLLYEFSRDLGMSVYTKSENVVLIVNNAYYGVYQLCELPNLKSDKFEIFDWTKAADNAVDAILEQFFPNNQITNQDNKDEKETTNYQVTVTVDPKYNVQQEDSKNITNEKMDRLRANMRRKMYQNLGWITSPYTFRYDVNEDGTPETYNISNYIEMPPPTGGVLLGMDSLAFSENNLSTMITDYSQPLYYISPKAANTNDRLYNNIKTIVQSFEHAIHNTDFAYHDQKTNYRSNNRKGGTKNTGYQVSDFFAPKYDGKHYSELFDMDSLVQNFLVNELAMNGDTQKNSNFLYKDIDSLFYMGPVWDFESGLGNRMKEKEKNWYPTQWYTTSPDFFGNQYYQSVQWNQCLIRDPYFLVRVYEKYRKIRKTLIEKIIMEDGTIDTYRNLYRGSAVANDTRWGYTYKEYGGEEFEKSVANMKEFITIRAQWMDQQMQSLDTFISSLGAYIPSKDLSITKIEKNVVNNYIQVTATINNPQITSITFVVNGKHKYYAAVKKGKVIYKIPTSSLISSNKIQNVIQIIAMDELGNYMIDSREEGHDGLAKSNYEVLYFDKNIDGIKQSVNDAVSAVKKQTSGYNIILFIAGIVCVLSIGGIVIIAKVRKN